MNGSTESDALSATLDIGLGGIIVALLIGVAFYVFMALALSRIFQKLGAPGWKAWVPVVNTITILELGGYSALWVIAAFVPVLNVVAAVIIILAINGINVRLGKGGGYTALYFFLAPVWAGLLGFGKTDPAGAPGALPNRFEQVGAPASVVPGMPVVKPVVGPVVVPVFGAAPASIPAAPSPGAPSPVPSWVSAPPGVQPVARAEPRNQVVPPPAQPAYPAQPVLTPIAAPEPVLSDFDDNLDIEATRISTRRPKPWILETDDGTRVVLTRPVVLIGRNPAQSAAHPDAQLVSVADTRKTVSKTHARMELADGAWTISDLHSTNGVVLIDEGGDGRELAAGSDSLLTERFLLGELPARIFLEH